MNIILEYLFAFGNHIYENQKDILETRAKRTVLYAYVENQAILEPILLYRAANINKQKGWAMKTVCEFSFYLPM